MTTHREKQFDLHEGTSAPGQMMAEGARVAVVHPALKPRPGDDGQGASRSPESRLAEAVGLAEAIDLHVIHQMVIPLSRIRPSTYLGKGKIEELAGLTAAAEITVVVMDCALSAVQQRNLERHLNAKVIDRTGLILEIFGDRARTREGRLQVELAHLTYQKSRLVRSWTHLERQRGGLGFIGGPGETQIEADRRMIDERITKIRRDLDQVVRTRGLHREARQRVPYPVVALVGYTNAGKSTLFNRLAAAGVKVEDQVFATLDPTMREVVLPSGRRVILSDTVGFISDLPTHLVAAFRATLEEVQEADIILHVRDISHPDNQAQKRDVLDVLLDLGIESGGRPRIFEVLNKLDRLDEEDAGVLDNRLQRRDDAVAVSALSGEKCDRLLAMIDNALAAEEKVVAFSVPHSEGSTIGWVYDHGEVLSREDTDAGTNLTVRLSSENVARLRRRPGVSLSDAAS